MDMAEKVAEVVGGWRGMEGGRDDADEDDDESEFGVVFCRFCLDGVRDGGVLEWLDGGLSGFMFGGRGGAGLGNG